MIVFKNRLILITFLSKQKICLASSSWTLSNYLVKISLPVFDEPSRKVSAPSKIRVARFCLTQYTKTREIYQITTTLSYGLKVFQMAVQYYKWPWKITTFSILSPFKMYPNWDFWFANKPSGRPVQNSLFPKLFLSNVSNCFEFRLCLR
jgi:hypothetical protein